MSIRRTLQASAVSLGAGIAMGVVYWAIHVQSPAPGPIALVGLLGMVAGQWVARLIRRRLTSRRDRRTTIAN